MIRTIDIVLAGVALVLTLPLIVIIAMVLLIAGERNVLFRQSRLGKNEQAFHLLKFTTMRAEIGQNNSLLTAAGDTRVSPVGRILRKTKLNELPQLLNVLLGHMSLIGPRPQVVEHFEMYTDEVRHALGQVRPGLSGIGSIVFRNEQELLSKYGDDSEKFYEEVIAPYKGELEAWYVPRASLGNYCRLIVLTLLAVSSDSSHLCFKVFPDLPKPSNDELKLFLNPGVRD